MKLNHLFGVLSGVLFLAVALTWWSFMPHSPDLQFSGPSARQLIGSPSSSMIDNRPRSSEPQEPSENDAAPTLVTELSGDDTLERRCLQLAERDPREGVILALNTYASDTHPGLLENLVGQWATQDLQASHEWVLQQAPGESRDVLMERVAFVCSQSDPVTAARIVTDEMTPGQWQTEAAIAVLHQWALRDLNAAAAWASAFPDGPLRQRAINEIEGLRKARLAGGQ